MTIRFRGASLTRTILVAQLTKLQTTQTHTVACCVVISTTGKPLALPGRVSTGQSELAFAANVHRDIDLHFNVVDDLPSHDTWPLFKPCHTLSYVIFYT